MKINSFTLNTWTNGEMSIKLDDGSCLAFELMEHEKNMVLGVLKIIFEARQPKHAEVLAKSKFEALPAPDVVEAEYSEITTDDEILF